MPNLVGRTLGGYRIIEPIGLGGMATVFKAYQPSMDRYVALKVLATHLTQDSTFVKRFEQEAKVIAKLEHARILPVYDHGQEDGYLYLVMRFVEAGTLKDHLKRGALPLEEARRIVTQVGSALAYAHRLGVIHRDLKPSNVLIDPQGDCYLTDFGIAKMVEGTLGLTGSGVLGTPHYMAPEQGQSLKVDHRADIYAMGVVIYEMVTGQLPFDAETPFAVLMKHVTEPLPLPRSVEPGLPEEVERVILKALAKEPADRYQSMSDLVTAFDRAVQAASPILPSGDRPVETPPVEPPPATLPLTTVGEAEAPPMVAESEEVEVVPLTVEGKKFGVRAGACITDIIALFVLNLTAAGIGGAFLKILLESSGQPFTFDEEALRGLNCIGGGGLFLLYFTLFEWLFGASPGKLIFGMRVVQDDGRPCSLRAAFVRGLARYVDGILFGLVAYASMKRTPLQQRLGDKMAGTLVVARKDAIIQQHRAQRWFLVAAAIYFILAMITVNFAMCAALR